MPYTTEIEPFSQRIQEICEPFANKRLSDISFSTFLTQLFIVSNEFNIPVQPQLALLQKTLLYVEGLGRQLYPDLDLWETAQPFINRWLIKQYHPATLIKEISLNPINWVISISEWKEKLESFESTLPKTQALIESQTELLNNANRKIKYLIFFNTTLLFCVIFFMIKIPY